MDDWKKVRHFNCHVMCGLCQGYLVDATTITECLHSFCRSCLVRHVEKCHTCPSCSVQLSTTKPFSQLKRDHTLQSIVYKMVPSLARNELDRRRRYRFQHQINDDIESLTEDRFLESFFTPDDKISISLNYAEPGIDFFATRSIINYRLRMKEKPEPEPKDTRYLLCPAALPVALLMKFLMSKYQVDGSVFHAEILFNGQPLLPEYKLLDVAYIFSWKQKEPLKLWFRFCRTNPVTVPELPLSEASSMIADPLRSKRKTVRNPGTGETQTKRRRVCKNLQNKVKRTNRKKFQTGNPENEEENPEVSAPVSVEEADSHVMEPTNGEREKITEENKAGSEIPEVEKPDLETGSNWKGLVDHSDSDHVVCSTSQEQEILQKSKIKNLRLNSANQDEDFSHVIEVANMETENPEEIQKSANSVQVSSHVTSPTNNKTEETETREIQTLDPDISSESGSSVNFKSVRTRLNRLLLEALDIGKRKPIPRKIAKTENSAHPHEPAKISNGNHEEPKPNPQVSSSNHEPIRVKKPSELMPRTESAKSTEPVTKEPEPKPWLPKAVFDLDDASLLAVRLKRSSVPNPQSDPVPLEVTVTGSCHESGSKAPTTSSGSGPVNSVPVIGSAKNAVPKPKRGELISNIVDSIVETKLQKMNSKPNGGSVAVSTLPPLSIAVHDPQIRKSNLQPLKDSLGALDLTRPADSPGPAAKAPGSPHGTASEPQGRSGSSPRTGPHPFFLTSNASLEEEEKFRHFLHLFNLQRKLLTTEHKTTEITSTTISNKRNLTNSSSSSVNSCSEPKISKTTSATSSKSGSEPRMTKTTNPTTTAITSKSSSTSSSSLELKNSETTSQTTSPTSSKSSSNSSSVKRSSLEPRITKTTSPSTSKSGGYSSFTSISSSEPKNSETASQTTSKTASTTNSNTSSSAMTTSLKPTTVTTTTTPSNKTSLPNNSNSEPKNSEKEIPPLKRLELVSKDSSMNLEILVKDSSENLQDSCTNPKKIRSPPGLLRIPQIPSVNLKNHVLVIPKFPAIEKNH